MPYLNIMKQASNLKYPQKQQVIYVVLLQSVEVTQWWGPLHGEASIKT